MTYEEYVEMRDALGLTNNQVARLSGVSTATLSQWKKGVYDPKSSTLAKIQDALVKCDSKIEVDYEYNDPNFNQPVYLESANHIRPINQRFHIDVYSIALPVPVELSDREFTELRKATEVFAESWLKMHKKI